MTTSNNVVQMWRNRPSLVRRQAFRCSECGGLSLVKRLRCKDCGATGESLERVQLPSTGTVVAATAAGAQIEQLDSVTTTTKAVLLELADGTNLACLVSDADTGHVLNLHGRKMYLAVRRIPGEDFRSDSPIPYGLKAALDVATRVELNTPQTETDSAGD